MKALYRIFGYIVILLIILQINNVYAERKELSSVPYIHQVQDMNQDNFLGHNACGPTSACMIARFHNVQPIPGSLFNNGWYVYNSYAEFTDKSERDYSTKSAMDMDSNWSHHHYVYGAHGYIITYSVVEGEDYWGTDRNELKRYLENHGLKVSQLIFSDRFDYIKKNIKAGLPLIGHLNCGKIGHFFVIVGYDTGENNDEENVIINDPYGDMNNTWDGTTDSIGMGVTYPLYGDIGEC